MPKITVQILSAFSDVGVFASQWNNLIDKSLFPNVFMRWEWIEAWWSSFGSNKHARIVLVFDDTNLIGALPLYFTKTFFELLLGRKLQVIGEGGPTCPEYLGPIVHKDFSDSVIEALSNAVLSTDLAWDIFVLANIAPDDDGSRLLIGQLKLKLTTATKPGEKNRFFQLPRTFDEVLGRLSPHNRRRRRAELRIAREQGHCELRQLNTVDSVEQFLVSMTELSQSSRAREGKASPFLRDDYRRFHETVIRTLLPSGIVKVFVLLINNSVASFSYGFTFHRKFYYFQTGFSETFSKFSPGDVILCLLIEHLVSDGVTEFDFLRGDHRYKTRYATGERDTESFQFFRKRGIPWMMNRFRKVTVDMLRKVRKQFSRRKSMEH